VVLNGTDTLVNAWAGGLWTPHFSHVDYDMDGTPDLAAFDRSSQSFLFWRWQNGRWEAQPDWALRMPKMAYFALFRDYNGDGKADLFGYLPGGGVHAYKNTSTPGNFQMTLTYPQIYTYMYSSTPTTLYVPATDLPAIEDVDGDGDLDFISFYMLGSYIHLHRNLAVESGLPLDSLKYDWDDQCWGKFRESNVDNSLILNKTCGPVVEDDPVPEHAGSTVTLFDKDGDGDWDVLIGDVSFTNIVYAQNGRVENSHPVDSMVAWQSSFPANHPMNVYLFPATSIVDADLDQKPDVVVTPFAIDVSDNRGQVLMYSNSASSGFTLSYQTNRWLQDEMIDVGSYASPAMLDVDGDGDLDLLVAGKRREGLINRAFVWYLENTGTGGTWTFTVSDTDYLPLVGSVDSPWDLEVGDVDGDGDDDILLSATDGRIRWLENTAGAGQPVQWAPPRDTLTGMIFSGLPSTAVTDVDGDGRPDLLVLVQASNQFFYFRNTASSGPPVYQEQTNDFGGGIEDAVYAASLALTDINGDGLEDIVLSSYSTPLVWVDNFRSQIGNFSWDTLTHTPSGRALFAGANSFLCPVVLPGDTLASLLVGTLRGGLTWLKNTNVITGGVRRRAAVPLVVFPQPADRAVTVMAPETVRELVVYGADGRRVYAERPQRRSVRIDVGRLTPGMYVLHVRTAGRTYVHSLLIQR